MLDIQKSLVPKIRARFGDRPIQLTIGTEYEMVFPCVHPEFGDVTVYDSGDVLTIRFDRFGMYDDFANDDERLSDAERAEAIAEDAVQFLEDVFADKIVFFEAAGSVAGVSHADSSQRCFSAVGAGSGQVR